MESLVLLSVTYSATWKRSLSHVGKCSSLAKISVTRGMAIWREESGFILVHKYFLSLFCTQDKIKGFLRNRLNICFLGNIYLVYYSTGKNPKTYTKQLNNIKDKLTKALS